MSVSTDRYIAIIQISMHEKYATFLQKQDDEHRAKIPLFLSHPIIQIQILSLSSWVAQQTDPDEKLPS